MTEWLFTFVVLAFTSPTDAQVIAGGAYIAPDEATCKKAMQEAKDKFKGALALVTCDPIKQGVTVKRVRGEKT